MLRRAQSKLYCVQPYTVTHTHTHTHTDENNVVYSQKGKRQEFFSRGKLERALCKVALMVHNTHTHIYGLGRQKGRKWGRRGEVENLPLYLLSSFNALQPGSLSRYQATGAFTALKNSGKERERESERCCLAMACCVVYTTKLSTQQNTVSEEDVYFVNADLVLVEKTEEVQPTFGLG